MKKYINILLLILWMMLIFFMSSFNATDSGNQSGGIVEFISKLLHIDNINALSLIIRKTAHFTEYFILGLLSINVLKYYNFNLNKIFIFSFIFCVFYACTDEFHQLFVPGRSGNILDVFIDSVGSLCGSCLIYLKKMS